jgi:CDP-diacylglycerol--glycerol-3-phosphate 3-phosphatidyltransferase
MRSDLFPNQPLISLRRRWWVIAALSIVLLGLGHRLLRAEWHPSSAWRWTLLAALVLAYELTLLWRGLKDNRRRGEVALLPTLGSANLLTLIRGLALGLLAGFLLSPSPSGWLAWLPAILYSLAVVADYLDGYLARITRRATLLGEALDIEFDALGILVATALAVHYKQLPGWYLLLGLSRYLFLLGIWWRRRQGKPVYDLPPSTYRRMVAGFQMSFISVALWPIIYPPATTWAGIMFAVPFTLSFARDWLVVTGYLDPTSRSYVEARRKVGVVATGWLPVCLRGGILVLSAWFILPAPGNAPAWAMHFTWPGVPFAPSTPSVIGLVVPVATVMLMLGVAGRLASLGLIMSVTANMLATGLQPGNALLFSMTLGILFLGSGFLSVWRPEDRVLTRHAGQREEH